MFGGTMAHPTPLFRITFLIIFSCISWTNINAQLITNGGFESGDLSSWLDNNTGTETISTTNVRTGTYNLSYSTGNASNQKMENLSTISIPNMSYLHCIAWAKGSNEEACASIAILTTGWSSQSTENIGTSLTRFSWRRQNTSGSTISDAQIGLNSRKIDGGTSTVLYWDDVIAYVSTNSTTDIIDPDDPTNINTVSNETGTSITVTWTDGTDTGEGTAKALILRVNGTGLTPPTLNDQGIYSTAGGADGPNSIGSWSIIGIVDVGTESYVDGTTVPDTDYTYAVYMRDVAYNYSNGASDGVTALPVELSSFTASQENENIILRWRTETEINNYGFEIERNPPSIDAWTKIGFVNGNGNCNSPKEYCFIDEQTSLPGTYHYKLKQIDFDGSFEYSNEVSVNKSNAGSFVLTQNYPNPFNPSTTICFELPVSSKIEIAVYDALGREIEKLGEGIFEAGRHNIEFQAKGLSAGVYFYSLKSENFFTVRKMLLLR